MCSNTVRHLGHFQNKLVCQLNEFDISYVVFIQNANSAASPKKKNFKNESHLGKGPQCVYWFHLGLL